MQELIFKKFRNIYNFLKENQENLKLETDIIEYFKNNIKLNSKNNHKDIEIKFPRFGNLYEEFLKSDKFKRMINVIKTKHDEEFLKLFFRHSKNFINLYTKNSSNKRCGRRLGNKCSNIKS